MSSRRAVAEGPTQRGKVMYVSVGTRMPTVLRTEGQYLMPLKTFIKNKAL
jgi:hypothetical protein